MKLGPAALVSGCETLTAPDLAVLLLFLLKKGKKRKERRKIGESGEQIWNEGTEAILLFEIFELCNYICNSLLKSILKQVIERAQKLLHPFFHKKKWNHNNYLFFFQGRQRSAMLTGGENPLSLDLFIHLKQRLLFTLLVHISRVHSENISQTFQYQGIHAERPGSNQGG